MSVLDRLDPYAATIKIVAAGLGFLALVVLFFSWMGRGQEIAALKEWRQSVVISTTDATVQADAKGVRKTLTPEQVPAAIAGLKRSWDSCQAASTERSKLADAAKLRADNADKALAQFQVVMNGEYSSAAKRIAALEKVKAAPTPQLQCQAIGNDSKAAWEGWK